MITMNNLFQMKLKKKKSIDQYTEQYNVLIDQGSPLTIRCWQGLELSRPVLITVLIIALLFSALVIGIIAVGFIADCCYCYIDGFYITPELVICGAVLTYILFWGFVFVIVRLAKNTNVVSSLIFHNGYLTINILSGKKHVYDVNNSKICYRRYRVRRNDSHFNPSFELIITASQKKVSYLVTPEDEVEFEAFMTQIIDLKKFE